MKSFAHSRRQMMAFTAVLVVAGAGLTTGCATRVKATAVMNPPPLEAFSAFGRIEVKPLRADKKLSASGLAKIQENLDKDLSTSLESWNKRPSNGRTLVIEPIVEELEFKHGAQRVLLGPLAGSSGVLMRLKVTDNQGRQIANPEFFQRADAMAAGWVMGVHDNLMLTRVANLASAYVINNYGAAKGGPTGADGKALGGVAQ